MKVDNNDPRPPYAQVADALRAGIESGDLAPGQRLPSGRDLAGEHGVALMTAQKAIDALRAEGLVTSHRGRGVFVSPAVPDAAADNLETLAAAVRELRQRVEDLESRSNNT